MSLLTLSFESKEESLSVRRFAVREAMSTPFDAAIVARSPNDEIDLESIVGKAAAFVITGGVQTGPRSWSGICTHMEQIQAEATGLSTYYLRIAPALWRLGQRRGNRIFEHMTIPDIVLKVLGEYGIKPTMKIAEPHVEHEYRVQFGETDFAFVSRLLEEEGISYAFEQVAEGAALKTLLVVSDVPTSREPRPGSIPFSDNPNDAAHEEYVTNARVSQRVQSGKVTIRDFDFTRPEYRLDGKSDAAKAPEDFYEHYHYLPSAFVKDQKGKPRKVSDEEAKRRSDIALASKRNDARQVTFRSNVMDLGAGMIVSIGRHPRKDLAPDKKLLVTQCVTDGGTDGEWSCQVTAAYADRPYRPGQKTEKPIMTGPESAVVVGPKGEEIHTDEFGRVRVQFHWDRDGKYDEEASCWVRASQGWAGAAWGMMALPRVGHEVLVDFFDGDPDQPVVVGRVYNARTKVPYRLPDEKTRSTWKSSSSPDSDGFNEIMFEDKAEHELVFVQGQRDLSKLVKATEMERVGANATAIVGATRTSVVAANDSVLVGEKYTAATVSVSDLKILTLDDPEFTLQKTVVDMVEGKLGHSTGRATQVLSGADISLDAGGDVIIKAGGDVIIEGSQVHINDGNASGPSVDAKAELKDPSEKPKGRILGAIKKAFAKLFERAPEAAAVSEIAGKKETLDVPHRTQVGATCGIAALGMVLDYWKSKDATQLAPSDEEIKQKAIAKGWSKTGETNADNRASLAKQYGYDAKAKYGASIDDLKKSVAAGNPPIVAFNVDKGGGNPQSTDTDRRHAAVIKGFYTKDGKDYVVATHGWPGAENKEWEVSEFEKSWDTCGRPMTTVTPKPKVS